MHSSPAVVLVVLVAPLRTLASLACCGPCAVWLPCASLRRVALPVPRKFRTFRAVRVPCWAVARSSAQAPPSPLEPTQQSRAGQVDTEYVRLASARAIGGQPEPFSRLFASPVFPFRVGSGLDRHTCPSPSSFASLLALIADGSGCMLECVRACSCCRLGSCRSPRLLDAAATHNAQRRGGESRQTAATAGSAGVACPVARTPYALARCAGPSCPPSLCLSQALLAPCSACSHAVGQRCARPDPLTTVGARARVRWVYGSRNLAVPDRSCRPLPHHAHVRLAHL